MLRDFLEKYEDNIITIVTIFLIILTIVIIIVTWVINVGKNYNNEVIPTDLRRHDRKNNYIGNSVEIISSDCIQNSEIYVFRYYYKNYNDYKYVNVIEREPNIYTITFDQDIEYLGEYNKEIYTGMNNNVECEASLIDIGNNFLKYNIKITNNNNNLTATIDMNDVTTFCLFGDDFQTPVSSVTTTSIEELTKNSSVNMELYFNISQEERDMCKGIRINNVNIGEEYFDIDIFF